MTSVRMPARSQAPEGVNKNVLVAGIDEPVRRTAQSESRVGAHWSVALDPQARQILQQFCKSHQRNLGDSGTAAPSFRGSEPPKFTPAPFRITD